MRTQLLFAGLPKSGKTTFLAALWHFVDATTDDNSLSLESISGENSYLEQISAKWLRCEKIIRTVLTKESPAVQMKLLQKSTGKKITLDVTDFFGETFRDHFDFREWSEDFDEQVEKAQGIILFVNAKEEHNKPKFLQVENDVLRFFGQAPSQPPEKPIPWNVNYVPHQVRLTELLQFLRHQKPNKRIWKVTVIISAWDTVQKRNENSQSPQEWLASNLPLLHQYLLCNENYYQTKYFGVSAQGGEYLHEDGTMAEEEALLSMEPINRIMVRDDIVVSQNIALPLLWMTNDD